MRSVCGEGVCWGKGSTKIWEGSIRSFWTPDGAMNTLSLGSGSQTERIGEF